jgi:hypothetical protein
MASAAAGKTLVSDIAARKTRRMIRIRIGRERECGLAEVDDYGIVILGF